MTIAPVQAAVDVDQTPAEAFRIFTCHMGEWWPGKTIGEKPFVSMTIEPHPGGKWYETDADGTDTRWGKVLAWEPPRRVLLAWELNNRFEYDPAVQTEVEVTFTPTAAGGTRVALEHRNLERFGDDAARIAGLIGEGWPEKLAGFAGFVATQTEGAAR